MKSCLLAILFLPTLVLAAQPCEDSLTATIDAHLRYLGFEKNDLPAIPDPKSANIRQTAMRQHKQDPSLVFQYLPAWRHSKTKPDELVRKMAEAHAQKTITTLQYHELRRWAPYWLRGEHGFDNAIWFYKSSARFQDVVMILRHLDPVHHADFEKFVTAEIARRFDLWRTELGERFLLEKEREILWLLSLTPLRLIPPALLAEIDGRWLHLGKFPPVSRRSIGPLFECDRSAGNCVEMSKGHLGTLFGFEYTNDDSYISEKQTYLVRIRGRLVGAVKEAGDPSMLALRHVMDEHGRLTLVMGATYRVKDELMNRFENEGASVSVNGWNINRVNSLQIKPNDFLLNAQAWAADEADVVLTLVKFGLDRMSKSDLVKFLRVWKGDSTDIKRVRQDMHAQIWPGFLKELRKKRLEIERNLKP